MEQEQAKLLNCPFCGSDVIHSGFRAHRLKFYRECCKCLALIDGYDTADDADRAWNNRARQWVDVADRQPDSDGWYLIVADFGNGYESAKKRYAIEVDGTGYWICSGATVVAWQPLPQPYQRPSAVEGDKNDE